MKKYKKLDFSYPQELPMARSTMRDKFGSPEPAIEYSYDTKLQTLDIKPPDSQYGFARKSRKTKDYPHMKRGLGKSVQ